MGADKFLVLNGPNAGEWYPRQESGILVIGTDEYYLAHAGAGGWDGFFWWWDKGGTFFGIHTVMECMSCLLNPERPVKS